MADKCSPVKASSNDFQTPDWPMVSLIPFLPFCGVIWEPCEGKGNMVRFFRAQGYEVIGSDIKTGTDFLTCDVPACDLIITNPPYSNMGGCFARAYEIGKPFAFLVPFMCFGTPLRLGLFDDNGFELVFLPRRVKFETPTGRTGPKSSPPWPVVWVTWKMNIGHPYIFTGLTKKPKQASLF